MYLQYFTDSVFLVGLPSKYWPSPHLLSFRDAAKAGLHWSGSWHGSGSIYTVYPLSRSVAHRAGGPEAGGALSRDGKGTERVSVYLQWDHCVCRIHWLSVSLHIFSLLSCVGMSKMLLTLVNSTAWGVESRVCCCGSGSSFKWSRAVGSFSPVETCCTCIASAVSNVLWLIDCLGEKWNHCWLLVDLQTTPCGKSPFVLSLRCWHDTSAFFRLCPVAQSEQGSNLLLNITKSIPADIIASD